MASSPIERPKTLPKSRDLTMESLYHDPSGRVFKRSISVKRNLYFSEERELTLATFDYSVGGLNFQSSVEYLGHSRLPTDYYVLISKEAEPGKNVAYLAYDLRKNAKPKSASLITYPHRVFSFSSHEDAFTTNGFPETIKMGQLVSPEGSDGDVLVKRFINRKGALTGEIQIIDWDKSHTRERELVFPESLNVKMLDFCARTPGRRFSRIVADPSIFLRDFSTPYF